MFTGVLSFEFVTLTIRCFFKLDVLEYAVLSIFGNGISHLHFCQLY